MELIIRNGVLEKCTLDPGETEVNVPFGVTVIGAGAFCAQNLETVTLHRGLKEIRQRAFEKCSELREIRIPQTVVSIGHRAFSHCKKLKSFTVPATVRLCGGYELEWCELLREVRVCTKGKTYTFPVERRELTPMEEEFGYFKYWQTDNMLPAILGLDLSASMNTDTRTRLFCRMLQEGFRADEIETLLLANAEEFFDQLIKDENAKALTMLLESGRVLGELPEDVFQKVSAFAESNDKLRDLFRKVQRIPEWTEEFTIRDGVLLRYNRKASGTVAVIPDEVTAIGVSAFEECRELREVYLPDSLKHIGNQAFYACERLETVVPESLRNEVRQGQLLLPEGMESIGDKAFALCQGLTSAVLPFSLQCIGNEAFSGDKNLQSFLFPYTVPHIGESVLSGAEKLDTITLCMPDGSRHDFPYPKEMKHNYSVLNMLVKKVSDLKHNRELDDYSQLEFACLMAAKRFDNGESAAYLYENKSQILFYFSHSDCKEAMDILIQSGVLKEPPLSALLPDLIVAANDAKNYDLQVTLTNQLYESGSGGGEPPLARWEEL